jgi:hypothetical protein
VPNQWQDPMGIMHTDFIMSVDAEPSFCKLLRQNHFPPLGYSDKSYSRGWSGNDITKMTTAEQYKV